MTANPAAPVYGLWKTKDAGLNFTHVMIKEIDPILIDVFNEVNITGTECGATGALAVDPTDPSVVYVGGSRKGYLLPGNRSWEQALMRVDTRNMLMSGGGGAVKNLWQTANIIRKEGFGAAVRSSIEDLADWAEV